MSLILTTYEDNIDKCWYDSTNILFSRCIDNENDFKDLIIVFNDGRSYMYGGLDVSDYILFKTDISQGKALNKYIIKKYKPLRLADVDISTINEEKNRVLNKQMENKYEPNEEDDSKTIYHAYYNDDTKDIELKIADKTIFKGVNGEIDLFELMASLGLKCKSINIK